MPRFATDLHALRFEHTVPSGWQALPPLASPSLAFQYLLEPGQAHVFITNFLGLPQYIPRVVLKDAPA